MLKSSLFLLSAASFAAAGDLYYAFFNDLSCKVGEGRHVDSTNGGCLKEYNRMSLRPAGGHGGLYYPILIGYSDDNCQHEIGCNAMPASDNPLTCTNFNQQNFQWAHKASSFRFQTHGAAPATCPNGCVGECPDGHAPRKRGSEIKRSLENESRSVEEEADLEERALGTRKAGNGYYAFCSNSDCTNCGTAINPVNGGCSIEGSRKSVYSSNSKTIVLSGYSTPHQTCDGPVTGTVRMGGKGCWPIDRSGAEGGPNAYQVTTIEDHH